jgi:hypothetical protein
MEQINQPVGKQYSPGLAAYPALYPQISNGFPQWDDAEFENIEMKPGSVLFIPRGTWHRSHASKDLLALSIVINPPVLLDKVLGQLRLLLLQSERWRQPLMGSSVTDLNQLLIELPQIVEKTDAKVMARSVCSSDRVFDAENEKSRFILNPDAKITRHPNKGNELVVSKKVYGGQFNVVADLTLNDAIMRLAMDIYKRQRPFSLVELLNQYSDLNKAQVVSLLSFFVQAGLLHCLDFPEFECKH